MKSHDPLSTLAGKIESVFTRHGVRLTLGGEPTFVPVDPVGHEWSITALGPTKLGYAYNMAEALITQSLPHALPIYSPGKIYPGEVNARWTIHLLYRKDGQRLVPANDLPAAAAHPEKDAAKFLEALRKILRIKEPFLTGRDPMAPERAVWVLPLDHDGKRFQSEKWGIGSEIDLLNTEGPAGLRLPLASLPAHVNRRAFTAEVADGKLQLFLPPLLQPAFIELLQHIAAAATRARSAMPGLAGYVPSDVEDVWDRLGIAADPGVLEINLPPCRDWKDYDRWMHTLESAATTVGLRSYKQISPHEQAGTGGGNHLLFGGPSLEHNALFTHPGWVTSILRYWQHHPALAYLFTGHYVGPSSQAPRPDESASALYDLEMAYQFLEQLPPGDHRQLLSETLRHLHTDGSGNTHRSETSFDKFWNAAFEGGCRGLIEFRAVESLPRAEWMSAIALLWRTLAAALLQKPFRKPLVDHGDALHDRFFLPSFLWADFKSILRDLKKAGFDLPEDTYRAIADWRFPRILSHEQDGARLSIRKAHEGWPLLCETPLEGGTTSRFVDTSIERLEFLANRSFAADCVIHVNGRRLDLQKFPEGKWGVGLRYRRTALYPSLHPGIAPQLPLWVSITQGRKRSFYQLAWQERHFTPADPDPHLLEKAAPCKRLHADLLTCDLRLP